MTYVRQRRTREQQTRKPGDRTFRVSRVTSWKVPVPVVRGPKTGGLSPLVLLLGFVGLIVIGMVLLMLPISSKAGQFTHPIDALFTATSAVCVTGLVVVDTGTYWNGFGQGVILVLIQVGGFGFMTSATLLLLALGRRIGLRERLLLGESMGLTRLGGLVGLIRRIAVFSAFVEGIGAIIFYVRFSVVNPVGTAVWRAIFQSVSAFNNAGFDIFGNFRSMLDYQADAVVVLVTAALILLGGISYVVVEDVFRARRFVRLSLDSKLVLTSTLALLVLGMVVILATEYSNPDTLGALAPSQKLSVAFFQSVTPRTAGFTTIDVAKMADYALFFIILLMFIGGAAGSTAGGVKVNTVAMLAATITSSIRGREHAGAFGREFTIPQIHRALTVAVLALGLAGIVVWILTITEEFRFINLLFETVSAFGTVGLSTGITPGLTVAGRLIVTLTMFVGRLGPLTLTLALVQRQQPSAYRYPEETIRIG